MIEALGGIATCFTLAGVWQYAAANARMGSIMQGAGSILWLGYGVLLEGWSIVVVNVILLAIVLYRTEL
jgi:hypothetical protein